LRILSSATALAGGTATVAVSLVVPTAVRWPSLDSGNALERLAGGLEVAVNGD